MCVKTVRVDDDVSVRNVTKVTIVVSITGVSRVVKVSNIANILCLLFYAIAIAFRLYDCGDMI